jgi:hypothetical protein
VRIKLKMAPVLLIVACTGGTETETDSRASSCAESGDQTFAWQIAHQEHSGLCQGPTCSSRTVIAGGDLIADDPEDWVAKLSPEEHCQVQRLATSVEAIAFMRADSPTTGCAVFTDYAASLEVRTVTVRDGMRKFEDFSTSAYGCLVDPDHPVGSIVAEIQALRQLHRPTIMPGTATICMSTDGPWPALDPQQWGFFGSVQGVIESFDFQPKPLVGTTLIKAGTCSEWLGNNQRTLALNAGQQQWRVVLGASTGLPRPPSVLPELPSLVGRNVQMTIHRGATQNTPEGIVLSEDGQLLFALQTTTKSGLLQSQYLAGLTVLEGPVVLSDRSTCGPRTHRALSFVGDGQLQLAPGEESVVVIAGLPYNARNIAYHSVEKESDCGDLPVRVTSWMVWRRP